MKLHNKARFICITLLLSSVAYIYAKEKTVIPFDRVMTIDEFKQAINNNEFLTKYKQTVTDYPLEEYEIELIELARKDDGLDFGGKFQKGRQIDNFTGSTLLVGGGKAAGSRGENDGKTILFDYSKEEKEIRELIANLRNGSWNSDPYTGKSFKSNNEKNYYISHLENKLQLYKEAFLEKNNDMLKRYYTINIEKAVKPDMLASITSSKDMSKIPNHKFMNIEFENVPCDVFLNPKLYPILERITKPNGKITFSISYVCRRLIIPVIQETKFGSEFIQKIKEELYDKPNKINATYGSFNIVVTNK